MLRWKDYNKCQSLTSISVISFVLLSVYIPRMCSVVDYKIHVNQSQEIFFGGAAV